MSDKNIELWAAGDRLRDLVITDFLRFLEKNKFLDNKHVAQCVEVMGIVGIKEDFYLMKYDYKNMHFNLTNPKTEQFIEIKIKVNENGKCEVSPRTNIKLPGWAEKS